jgi:cell division transport system permease protein
MVQTLRLTILRRKEVVNLLEIIGASESTIRGPFVFEGSFYGICGGLISGISLFFLNMIIKKLFNIHLSYMDLVFSISLLFGLLLGFMSSLIAVSQRERQEAW